MATMRCRRKASLMSLPLILAAIATVASTVLPSSAPVSRSHSFPLPMAWIKHAQQHSSVLPAPPPPGSCKSASTSTSATMMHSWPRMLSRRRFLPAYGASGRGRRGQPYGGRGGRGGRGGLSGRGEGGIDLSNWTNRLLALNVAIFIAQQVDPSITLMGAKNDQLIRRGELYRLFTPMLLHGDIQHLMANSYTMYNLGHFIEPLFGGPMQYLALYILSGLAGNALSFVSGRAPISIGASTAVSGLLGAVGLFCYRHRHVWNLEGPLRSVAQAVVINGVLGMSSARIDNFGHLGGLVGGAVCGWLFGPRLVPLTTREGVFRGYVNSPILQTGWAALGRQVRGRLGRRSGLGAPPGKGGARHGWARRDGGKEEQRPPSCGKKAAWWAQLGKFLHRGGEDGGGGGPGRLAFVETPGGAWRGREKGRRSQGPGRRVRRGGMRGAGGPFTTGLALEVMMGRRTGRATLGPGAA